MMRVDVIGFFYLLLIINKINYCISHIVVDLKEILHKPINFRFYDQKCVARNNMVLGAINKI